MLSSIVDHCQGSLRVVVAYLRESLQTETRLVIVYNVLDRTSDSKSMKSVVRRALKRRSLQVEGANLAPTTIMINAAWIGSNISYQYLVSFEQKA